MKKDEAIHFLSNDDKQRIIEIAKQLISRESDSLQGQEGAVGEYITAFFDRIGIPSDRQYCAEDRFNVIARIPGKDHTHCTMYCGHMDTVPFDDPSLWTSPACTPEIRGGKLFGRGACDMKGSLACTLFMAEYFSSHKITPETDILLVYDVDEENTNLGAKTYLRNPDKVDFVIVGEPTDLTIDVGHRGVMAFTVEVIGKSAHVGQAKFGINSIYVMMEIIKEVTRLQDELCEIQQEYLGSPSIHITQIWAGEKVNVIPSKATIRVDRRLVNGETREGCKEQLDRIVRSVCTEYGCRYSISVTTFCPPGKTDYSCTPVQAVASLLSQYGMDDRPRAFHASCEAGLFQERLGVPVVIFGPGSIAQAHQADEFVSVEQLYVGAELFINLFSNFAYK